MNLFTVGVIVMCAAMILCWAYNFIRAGREKPQSVLARRGLYICGMGAVALNLFRIFQIYTYSLTSIVLANVVAFLCILIAFIRSERGKDKGGTEAKKRKALHASSPSVPFFRIWCGIGSRMGSAEE